MSYDNWVFKSRYPKNIVKSILENRNVRDLDKFIKPKYEDLIDTFVFSDMQVARDRIEQARRSTEKIGVFMDYDADGVCGGAIIYKVLKFMSIDVEYYVPERNEGYGLNLKAIDFFVKKGVSLLITVDCGVKNHKEIAQAKKAGLDVIVVDHHQLDDKLPEAMAIIHPKRLIQKNDLDLSGGGVAYMLARAVLGDAAKTKWLLDLAAISSVADVVPITNNNRTMVKYGLIVLNKTKNIGLKRLLKVAGVDNKEIGVYDIGFVIAPRLNAAGRIAHPKDAFRLLVSEDSEEAAQIALKLNHLNEVRQDKLSKSIKEAELEVLKTKQQSDNLIVVIGEWDEGIIGLIASKICEKYYRPTIVLTKTDGFYKGSARSIKQINITDMIATAQKHTLSFGGHVQAAGLSIESKELQKFILLIKKNAKVISKDSFIKNLTIDALVNPSDITLKLAEDLEKLQPFGVGNPKPVFALQNLTVKNIKVIGKDSKHQKVTLCNEDTSHQCLMFDYLNKNWFVEEGDSVNIAFNVNINEWRDRRNLDLIIEDVQKN